MATPVNVVNVPQQAAPQVFVGNTTNPRGMNVKIILGLGKTILIVEKYRSIIIERFV